MPVKLPAHSRRLCVLAAGISGCMAVPALKAERGKLKQALRSLLMHTPLADFPVRIRSGPAQGARWTLFPFSMYWRLGGDTEVVAAAKFLPQIRGSVFWDFGAHFGIHSVEMALKVGPGGQVVSFEPDGFSFRKLSRHVHLNRLENVKLFNAAVSNQSGTGQMLFTGTGASTQHFAYPDEEEQRTGAETMTVKAVRADDLVAAQQIRPPDFIKIDVEGHGASALQGGLQTISKHKPLILMSSHSAGETDGARQLLEPLGYSVFALSGERLSWPELTCTSGVLRAG